MSLAVSTGYIILTCAICAILRRLVGAVTVPGLGRLLLLELIAAMDLCGCCFELIVGKYLEKSYIYDRNKCVSYYRA